MLRPLLALLAFAALAAAPAASHAGSFVIGYDGTAATADAVESHSADTVYWSPEAARTGGQLRYVSIWGSVVQGGGTVHFRFVVLHPQPDGTLKVEQVDPTVRGLALNQAPTYRGGNKSPNWSLCLHEGDHLGLWKLGHGTLQIFRSRPGSLVSWYEDATGLAQGEVFAPAQTQDRELLMQALVETGKDAYDHCPGGYENHVYENLTFGNPPARLAPNANVVRLRVRCPAATYGGCFGRLSVRGRIGGRQVTLGRAPFSFRSGKGGTLSVPVSAAHAAFVRSRGALSVDVVMKGHDDPSDARNRRAAAPRPGRQTGTDVRRAVLRAQS